MATRTLLTTIAALLLLALPTHAGEKQAALDRLKLEPSCPDVQKQALAYFNINKEALSISTVR